MGRIGQPETGSSGYLDSRIMKPMVEEEVKEWKPKAGRKPETTTLIANIGEQIPPRGERSRADGADTRQLGIRDAVGNPVGLEIGISAKAPHGPGRAAFGPGLQSFAARNSRHLRLS